MFKWFRRKTGLENGQVAYEEVNEKKTTKVGYFFLILMVIFLVSAGQIVFSDLRRIPEKPDRISYCANSLANILSVQGMSGSSYGYGRYDLNGNDRSNCDFSSYEIEVGLDQMIQSVSDEMTLYRTLGENISSIEKQLSTARRDRSKSVQNYDVSLQEKQANVDSLYESDAMQQQLSATDTKISSLNTQLRRLKTQQSDALKDIESGSAGFAQKYSQVGGMYDKAVQWQKFKIFMLKVLFVAPFFAVSLYQYFRLKRNNSQYAIIAGGVLVSSAILLLQVVFILLYEIIPPEVINAIVAIFTKSAFMRYVLYYGSILLVIALFGGIVYYIQKKVFDPQAVAIRHLKDHKCPKCSFVLDNNVNFCPRCAYQVRERCGSCDRGRYREMPHCEWCGASRNPRRPIEEEVV